MARVSVKRLTAFSQFERCVEIQRAVWRHPDLDLTPTHQLCIAQETGAILLGAFVDGEMAGFVYSFPALRGRKAHLHSHLLAVLPEFQGLGLGKRLKWAQREEALKAGYRLITWTFDPLQTKNANLNLQALGACSRIYLPNFYGMTPALCLGPGVPTDRLLIEWPIRDKRVASLAAGRSPGRPADFDPERLPKALERRSMPEEAGACPAPRPPRFGLRDPVVLVEVPKDIRPLGGRPDLIASWQKGLRRTMTRYFGEGYRAGFFLFDDRCFYALMK